MSPSPLPPLLLTLESAVVGVGGTTEIGEVMEIVQGLGGMGSTDMVLMGNIGSFGGTDCGGSRGG